MVIRFDHIFNWLEEQDWRAETIKNSGKWKAIQLFLRCEKLAFFDDVVETLSIYEIDETTPITDYLSEDIETLKCATGSEKMAYVSTLIHDQSVSSKIRLGFIKIRSELERRQKHHRTSAAFLNCGNANGRRVLIEL